MSRVTLVVVALLAAVLGSAVAQQAGLVNKKVDRVIDISSQLVTITCRIVIENTGKSPITSYTVSLDETHAKHLAFIAATIGSASNEKTKNSLQVSKQVVDGADVWKIDLGAAHAIAPGAVGPVLEVEAVFTQILTPYPTHITQGERQTVLYSGDHYYTSLYPTKTQSTKVKLPAGGSIETYSKLKPTSQSDSTISYGPYENIPAKALSKLTVHYENNSPFLTVTNLDRTIEVSHWAGIISVEEILDVRHTGAILKGAFSRYEFQREPTNGISAVKSFKTKLPAVAQDVYYRDEIGNISTSNVRKTSGHVVAELRPRFPLFGGWKTHYTLGYYVPSANYLFNDGNQFILRIPFVGHIFDNSVVEDATVKIILPEGASDIKLRVPFSVNRDKDQIRKTYLDTIGRTTIVLQKSNLVERHGQDFEIQYSYNRMYMLQEPFLLVAALFLLCVLVMISVRLDFSISSSSKKSAGESVKEGVPSEQGSSKAARRAHTKAH